MNENELQKEYDDLIRFIQFSLQELPTGVLYGVNSATEEECQELMTDLSRLERMSEKLSIDNAQFIKNCRWHFEKYPHYLSQKSQFSSYEEYILKHNGPMQVQA